MQEKNEKGRLSHKPEQLASKLIGSLGVEVIN